MQRCFCHSFYVDKRYGVLREHVLSIRYSKFAIKFTPKIQIQMYDIMQLQRRDMVFVRIWSTSEYSRACVCFLFWVNRSKIMKNFRFISPKCVPILAEVPFCIQSDGGNCMIAMHWNALLYGYCCCMADIFICFDKLFLSPYMFV